MTVLGMHPLKAALTHNGSLVPAAQRMGAQFMLPKSALDFRQIRSWIEAILPAGVLLVIILGELLFIWI